MVVKRPRKIASKRFERCVILNGSKTYKYPGEKTHGFNRGMIARISLNISVFSFDYVAVFLVFVYCM